MRALTRRVVAFLFAASPLAALLAAAQAPAPASKPAAPAALGPPGVAALVGVVAGTILFARRWARWLALAVGLALTGCLCLAAAWGLQTLCNPIIPALALVVAGELAALARGVQRARGT